MHDVNGTKLEVGDNVLIPGVITNLCVGTPDYCNVSVQTALGRRPDGEKESFSAINTAQMIKVSGGGMSFGLAIEALKNGLRVCRAGWNGKGMWLAYMSGMTLPPFNTQGTDRKVNDRTAKFIGEDTPLETLPYIAMWTADKKWLPGWLASQTEILANDWMIVD